MAKDNNKPLSDLCVKALKPDQTIKDAGENAGLNVSCNKSGVKTFFYRYRSPLGNKVKRVTIGIYGEMTLAQARVELTLLKAKRKSGICPRTELDKAANAEAERLSMLADEEVKNQFTVKEMAELYLSRIVEDHPAINDKGQVIRIGTEAKIITGTRKRLRNQREARRTLEAITKDTTLGKLPASDVNHEDVIRIIEALIIKGTNVQAGRALSELGLAYTHTIGTAFPIIGKPSKDWIVHLSGRTVNPCLQAKAHFVGKNVKFTAQRRKRVFDDHELRLFLDWLPTSKFSQISKHALMITLICGVRSGEAVGAIKKDFDLDAATWALTDTKTGADQTVQLSTQAINYLRPLLENRENETPYLLPSQRTKKPQWQKQLSEQSWKMRKEGNMLNIPEWTAHDLRRTMRTGLAKLRIPSEVAEMCIGHGKGGIEAVYNLHEYTYEIKDAMQKWGDHIDIIAGRVDNFSSIKKKA